ncbi:MAG: CbiX/SirB N-terminal domain-containing protein [Proteobacteria bacterium]|nr:CbiX/SirB N-terminal domain-containing protein [Pseudomonadota bacterium]MBU1388087.1 CbiX/SirB N-terminal domain-containing protein [Pseudomonadota bacterium]MBU1542151.1 CbiX/SirB N-terminal domain-containing protein [Pseudomonadota bacterium]MBU2481417.1 CbiX/SirB N-terminal domain-containing protein [Pseudomonadota bacterium]
MKALIIAAHGSRKKESNLEVAALVARLSQKVKGKFDIIEFAFLQMAEPLLETRLAQLAQTGVKQLVIFPLFIASGSHITMDIPQLVQKARDAYPEMDIRVTDHLGKIPAIEDVIIREVS